MTARPLLAWALVGALCACGGTEEATPPPAPVEAPEPTPAPEPVPALPAPVNPAPASPTPPAADGGGAAPAAGGDLRGDVAEGARLYALYCATCHGAGGKGDGPAGRVLNPPPADHTDPAYMDTLSDAHIYNVIKNGGAAVGKSPLMAPWGGIVGEQGVADLVAFVRSLSDT